MLPESLMKVPPENKGSYDSNKEQGNEQDARAISEKSGTE